MAEGYNKCFLLGNIAADVELRYTQGGQAVLNIRLATNESYLDRDKQRKERTEYHSVVVWNKRGEALANILSKGSAIFVEGSLRTTSYEKDGTKRYRTEVIASNVILAGGRKQAAEHDADETYETRPAREPRAASPQGDDDPPPDSIPF